MRKIDQFTASHLSVCVQKLSRAFAVCMYMLYVSCNMYAKTLLFFCFFFFIKCMQSMTMTLSRRCAYVRLHVSWSKSLLYIFSLINHIDSLRKQTLSTKKLLSLVLLFSRLFVFFSLYSFVFNNHFLVAIWVLFKYFSIAILSILMINNVNIMFVFLNCAFALSCRSIFGSMHVLISYTPHFTTFIFLQKSITNSIWLQLRQRLQI